jgi:hypothetical protein
MTINFEDLLPEGIRETMITERIKELAVEGLAQQLGKMEAEARGNIQDVIKYEEQITEIISLIHANQAQLPQ